MCVSVMTRQDGTKTLVVGVPDFENALFPPIVRVICLSKAQKMSNETCCLFGWECVHIEAATPCVGGRLAATAYSNTHTLDDGQLQQQQ